MNAFRAAGRPSSARPPSAAARRRARSNMELAHQASVMALAQAGSAAARRGRAVHLHHGRGAVGPELRRDAGHASALPRQQPHRRFVVPGPRDAGRAGARRRAVRRGADRLRQQPALVLPASSCSRRGRRRGRRRTSRCVRSRRTRWPRRATCTSTARPRSSSARWRSPRAAGRSSTPRPSCASRSRWTTT